MLAEKGKRAIPRVGSFFGPVDVGSRIVEEGVWCPRIGFGLASFPVFLEGSTKSIHMVVGDPSVVFSVDVEHWGLKVLERSIRVRDLPVEGNCGFDIRVDGGKHKGI
jgi:hypothetical protein